MITRKFIARKSNEEIKEKCKTNGVSPFLSFMLSCRTEDETLDFNALLNPHITDINHPHLMLNMEKGATRIVEAILTKDPILAIGDFDADGQCGNSVIYQAFRMFCHPPELFESVVGNRLTEGYGLTAKLCDRILNLAILPSLVITTDCGSSDEKQIKRLKEKNIDVIVTDHHEIPNEGVPASAFCTINPKQQGCEYPDKDIAGCMVSWLLMCITRTLLVSKKYFEQEPPNMRQLLDYVAVGTIADAVSIMSVTNRYVIREGLSIMNKLERPCWKALASLLKLNDGEFSTQDVGFQIGPRINARSRMNDPYAALLFLLAETELTAQEYLAVLDSDNTERKTIQSTMAVQALNQVGEHLKTCTHSVVVYDDTFHAGIQGIVASRLTDKFGVPSIVFSPTETEGVCTGSARTIETVHIRQVLQAIDDDNPGLILQFGGHQGAAGLKINMEKISKFRILFEQEIIAHLGSTEAIYPTLKIDCTLAPKGMINMGAYRELQKLEPFGNGFEEPLFGDYFNLQKISLIGSPAVHARLDLKDSKNNRYQAVWFNVIDKEGDKLPVLPDTEIVCAYTLNLNKFRGRENLQLLVKHAQNNYGTSN